MRDFIARLCCFLAATTLAILPCLSAPPHLSVVARKNAGGGGGGGFSITETFEATGYDNTEFTTQAGSPNPDYATTPAPLVGTKSLSIPSSATNHANNVLCDIGSELDEVWGKATVYFEEATDQASFFPIFLYNGTNATTDANIVANVTVQSSSQDRWRSNVGYTVGLGTQQTAAANSCVTNTQYWIWWRYKKGTGTDAIFQFWYNTSDNKAGATLLSTTDGQRTDGCRYIRFCTPSTVLNRVIWDQITVSDSEIDP